MVALTNHVIDWAVFTLREASGTLEIFAKSSCQIQVKAKKKVLPSERGALGTVSYGKFGPGYCVTFIKRLNEGLRLQLLG